MNLKELLQYFREALSGIYDEQETAAIFDLLVAHVSGFSSRELLLKGISTEVQDEFTLLNYLSELKQGKPVQYVVGETVFYGMRFLLDANVLIPRPETEELVEWVIESCRDSGSATIIDIGTGSGCIAVSLKKHIAGSMVMGLDISQAALKIALSNAALNKVEVNFVQANVLDPDFSVQDGAMKFDVIVSNPPYITPSEKAQMHQNVMDHEPHLALFVTEERPLVFYEAIADFAKTQLKKQGLLFFEINEHLAKETVQMLADKTFINIEIRKDMQGKDRMIRCSLAV